MKRAMTIAMTMVMLLAAGSASTFARVHGTVTELDSAGAARTAGRNAMCLGMDLRHAEWMIQVATEHPDLAGTAEDAVFAALYHLDGTEEGEILWMVLDDETSTIEDLGTAVEKVVAALMGKYHGEEQWAFYTGSVLIDLGYFAFTGDEESLADTVEQLAEVIAEAKVYLSAEEMKPLEDLEAIVTAKARNEEDLVAMDLQVGNFMNLYFGEA